LNKRKTGKQNEDKAVDYLIKNGYTILDRNFYTKYGEIDIVAYKDDTIVIVEVRSLCSKTFGTPQESVNHSKIRKILNTAQVYLYKKGLLDKSIRFDVIAIYQDQINHIENAFTFDFY
jgi:putative endonuclease